MARQKHVVPMKSLLEAGVHFGHRTPRWNPKMKQYIFTQRNGIHILDLQQTIRFVDQAYQLVVDAVSNGGIVLFVGTKRQAQGTVEEEADRCGMPYVNQRWLGGTLTNWRTIRQRIDYMLDLERQQARGEFSRLVKKEALAKEKEIARLNKRFGGLRNMRNLPHLVFITDTRRETIAVQESNVLGIPILAMIDTNCNPDPIDHIIPSNDDAIRAIRLLTSKMADAVLEGKSIRETEEAEVEKAEVASDDDLLGPSTLRAMAKLKEEEVDEPESNEAAEAPAATAPVAETSEAVVEEAPVAAEAEAATVEASAAAETTGEAPAAEASTAEEDKAE
ncbi:MAG: 30S ribosomal protein S2 [Chloroflexota bacterium]